MFKSSRVWVVVLAHDEGCGFLAGPGPPESRAFASSAVDEVGVPVVGDEVVTTDPEGAMNGETLSQFAAAVRA
jgi:hypothetical protein